MNQPKNYEIELDYESQELRKIPLELFRIAEARMLLSGGECRILLFNVTEETREQIVRLLSDVLSNVEKRFKEA